jgi:hypothetical protein
LTVRPDRKVNIANHATVICKVTTRPKRSASKPAPQPPTADMISATVATIPACPLLIPHSATSAGTTKL